MLKLYPGSSKKEIESTLEEEDFIYWLYKNDKKYLISRVNRLRNKQQLTGEEENFLKITDQILLEK